MNQTTYQPPMAPPQLKVTYAGFWKRLAAHLIDKIIIGFGVGIIVVPIAILFGISLFASTDGGEYDPGLAFIGAYFMLIMLLVIIVLALEWLYYATMESRKGATLGKMVLNIRVTDLEGNQVSFGRASGRYFGKILSNLTLGIGYIIAGFSQQKQALHDIVARTLVVNNR